MVIGSSDVKARFKIGQRGGLLGRGAGDELALHLAHLGQGGFPGHLRHEGGRIEAEEEVAELWALALKLEGLTRNVGMHAGGVLIAPGKLTDFCPLYSPDGTSSVVSQFDKDDVEKAGLVKFDFLGLRTLTIIEEALRLAREVEGAAIDLATLPLDDRKRLWEQEPGRARLNAYLNLAAKRLGADVIWIVNAAARRLNVL
jgi:hypothetical protein